MPPFISHMSDGWVMAACSISDSLRGRLEPASTWWERGPAVDLPFAHVGIHIGPVISQDADVYRRTVNLAARIASYARAVPCGGTARAALSRGLSPGGDRWILADQEGIVTAEPATG
jgi:class 3 adenylate cyclase